MKAKELLKLREALDQSGVMVAYCGYMTEQVRAAVGETLKQKLTAEDIGTKTMRSVFAVFVEQMQNIIRYSAEQVRSDIKDETSSSDMSVGILTIGRENKVFVVQSGNLVRQEDVHALRARLERVQTMSKTELKSLYVEHLRRDTDGDSKGAGVGIVEMAWRASEPIEFDFSPVDEGHVFFALKTRVYCG